jgi:hypothetical protein
MRKFLIDYIKGDNGLVAYIRERHHDNGGMDYVVELQQRGVVIDNAGPFETLGAAKDSARGMAWAPLPTLEGL